jgi:hypothetical protein
MSDTRRTGAQILAQIKPKPHEKGTYICLRADLVDDFYDAVNEKLVESQVDDATSPRLASGVSARTKKLAQAGQRPRGADRGRHRSGSSSGRCHAPGSPSSCRSTRLATATSTTDRVGYDRDAMQDAQIRESSRLPGVRGLRRSRGCEHDDCGTWQRSLNAEPVRVRRARPSLARGQRGGDGGPKIAAGVADSRQGRLVLKAASRFNVSPRVFDGWVPREVHETYTGESGRP